MNMIVVTGANGFIGSNVVAHLNKAGRRDVVAVDNFPTLRACPGAMELVTEVRYLDRMQVQYYVDMHELLPWLDRHSQRIETIIHIGAHTDTTVTDRDYVMATNLDYSQMLWRWCTDQGVPLIYASSAATYGDGGNGYDDEVDPSVYRPLNLYGESKHQFDLWALEQASSPPRWVGLKYFNVYGPREGHKDRMASVVYHAFNQICNTGCVKLFQSHKTGIAHGEQRRDFVYVRDAVNATLYFTRTPMDASAPNGLYNVGTGQARTFHDLAKALFNALELKPKIEFVPMPKDLRDKYQYFTQATTRKLTAAGAHMPLWTIEQGIADYVKYLRETQSYDRPD